MDEKVEIRFKELENKLIEIEKSQIGTTLLVNQFIETNKELSSTMKHVEKTMVEMQISLKENNKDIAEMNCIIGKLNDKMYYECDKNKIDMREILKSILFKGGFGILGAYGVYELIIKFLNK